MSWLPVRRIAPSTSTLVTILKQEVLVFQQVTISQMDKGERSILTIFNPTAPAMFRIPGNPPIASGIWERWMASILLMVVMRWDTTMARTSHIITRWRATSHCVATTSAISLAQPHRIALHCGLLLVVATNADISMQG